MATRLVLALAPLSGCLGDGTFEVGSTGSPEPDWVVQDGSGTSTGGVGSEDGSEESGGGACPVCAEPAPDGWQGPVVRTLSPDGAPVECGGAYPTADLAFFDDFIEPEPTECSCECRSDVSKVCYTGAWRHDASPSCDSYTEFVPLTNDCIAFNSTSGSMAFRSLGSGVPDCQPVLQSTVPEFGWGALITSCKPGQEPGPACDAVPGGVCWPAVPDGFEAGLCIWSQGEVACPDGSSYADRRLVYNGVAQDSRTCSVCSCGDLEAYDCAGAAEAFASEDCSGAAQTLAADACTPVDGVASARLDLDLPLTCEQFTDSQPVGSIQIDGIFTYCCASPS